MQLNSILFEPNSLLESIECSAFEDFPGPEKIIFPASLKSVDPASFYNLTNLKTVVFLSKEIEFEEFSFHSCINISYIAFPYADSIKIDGDSFHLIKDDAKICVLRETKIDGYVGMYGDYLHYIEDEDLNYIENLIKVSPIE